MEACIATTGLWGVVFLTYPVLNNRIQIEIPPIGDVTTIEPRSEIFKIPFTATAILFTNLLAALLFQWRERAAANLLLSGGIFFQAVFWIAAFVAYSNA